MADLTRRLARLRVPLGFAFAFLVFWLSQPSRRTLLVGGVVAVTGEALRVWAAGHLNKSREVTASGPYRFFAHPLYVGSSIMGGGLAIASGSVVVAAIIALYLGATIKAAISSEEAFLRSKFGSEYDSYRRGEVGVRDAGASTRAFSVAQAMANREYRAVAGLAATIVVLALEALYWAR